MPIDISLHTKGFLSFNTYVYKDIKNHNITFENNCYTVSFNYTPQEGQRKGKDVYMSFILPINSLYKIGVRQYE